MASSAPQEVLSLIVHHLTQLDKNLSRYTLVNKSWQAAFEKQIYTSIVVRSPSDVTTITVSDEERHDKHGIPLDILINITSGPQDWQRTRRTYVRHILYRVAVPYWLSEAREKDDDYTYDNIALQAEDASTDEESGEPESIPTTGTEDSIAPYRAEFLPRLSLLRASCITSLEFPELVTPAMMHWEDDSAPQLPCFENKISLPACLAIASACGALKDIRLSGGDDIPSTEPDMRSIRRTAAAEGFSQLPQTVRDVTLCWSSPLDDEIPEPRNLNESAEQDLLCVTLHKVSMQLQHLRIENLEVFPELFCANGVSDEAHWPYLETLRLDQVSADALFGGVARYADGATPEDALTKQYIDDLYTSLGHAAQKMPCLKSVVLNFASLGHELRLLLKDERRILRIYLMKDYRPSSEVLKAWKVPGDATMATLNVEPTSGYLFALANGTRGDCEEYTDNIYGAVDCAYINPGVATTDLTSWNPSLSPYSCTLVNETRYCTILGDAYVYANYTEDTPYTPGPANAAKSSTARDNCSSIEAEFGINLAQFYHWNPSINQDCTGLQEVAAYCVLGEDLPEGSPPGPTQVGIASDCQDYYVVESGDGCQSIADASQITVTQLEAWNPAVGSDCKNLQPGYALCKYCGDLASDAGITLDQFYKLNPAVGNSCQYLVGGDYYCVATSSATKPTSTSKAASPTCATAPGLIQTGVPCGCTKFIQQTTGKYCGDLASSASITLDQFYAWNPAVGTSCQFLAAGNYYCVAAPACVKAPGPSQSGMPCYCKQFVQQTSGKYCGDLAGDNGITLTQFYAWNPAVGDECQYLVGGDYYCVSA
ncbi:hypothetical protein E4T42_05775 [Aureobasidium subglaciale]|nr:hypothetical protein E4T42_05775 [Aureobasidium subglaciale]